MEIILILYVIMIPITYYLERKWDKNKFGFERDWADVIIGTIISIFWPVFIIPVYLILTDRKPPKWL